MWETYLQWYVDVGASFEGDAAVVDSVTLEAYTQNRTSGREMSSNLGVGLRLIIGIPSWRMMDRLDVTWEKRSLGGKTYE